MTNPEKSKSSRKRKIDEELIIPRHSTKEFLTVQLDNGLRAMLISTTPAGPKRVNMDDSGVDDLEVKSADDQTINPAELEKTSHACLTVPFGCFQQPADGIAHLLEHVLVKGFHIPDEDDFSIFSMNVPHVNAFTHFHVMTFEIQVPDSVLPKMLNDLAQVFIEPTLAGVESELHIVDHEFWLKQCHRKFRFDELLSHVAHESHPMSNFLLGNRESLMEGTDMLKLRQQLLSTFEENFSADSMTLCVHSALPIATLHECVEKSFSHIKKIVGRKGDHRTHVDDTLFAETLNFAKLYKIQPIAKNSEVRFTWMLPPQQKHYTKRAVEYLKYIIEHKEKGGLYDNLQEKHYVYSLKVDTDDLTHIGNPFCTRFSIFILLTDEGAANIAEVTKYVHQFLNKIRYWGPREWLWSELNDLSEMEFNYVTIFAPKDFVTNISVAMQYVENRHYIFGSHVYGRFDARHIQFVMNCMTPERCNTVFFNDAWIQRPINFTDIEPRMGTRFTVESYPEQWQKEWENDLTFQKKFSIPNNNEFIPKDFSINLDSQFEDQDAPKLLLNIDGFQLWYFRDYQRHKLPTCHINLHFSDIPSQTSKELWHVKLTFQLLTRMLDRIDSYCAQAGLKMSFLSATKSILLYGFSDTLPKLARIVLQSITQFSCSNASLEIMKKKYLNDIDNRLTQNSEYALDLLRRLISPEDAVPSLRTIIKAISEEDVMDVRQNLLDSSIKMYVHGNLTLVEINELLKNIRNILSETDSSSGYSTPKSSTQGKETRNSSLGEIYIRVLSKNPVERSSTVMNFYSFEKSDYSQSEAELHAMMEVLLALFKMRLRREFRESLLLDYHPTISQLTHSTGVGLCIRISTFSRTLTKVDRLIDGFIDSMRDELKRLDQVTFNSAKKLVLRSHMVPMDTSSKERTDLFWKRILAEKGKTFPKLLQPKVGEITDLRYEKFKSLALRFVESQSSDRKNRRNKISIQVASYERKILEECEDGDKILAAHEEATKRGIPYTFDYTSVKLLQPRDKNIRGLFLKEDDDTFKLISHSLEELLCGMNEENTLHRRTADSVITKVSQSVVLHYSDAK